MGRYSDEEPDWDTDEDGDEEEDSDEDEEDDDEEDTEDEDDDEDEEETDDDDEDEDEDSDEDEDEDDDDEDEDSDEEDEDGEFEDEPGMVATGSNIDVGGPEALPGDEERGFDDDPDKPQSEGNGNRAKTVAGVLCCCCIVLAVVGIVLGVVVFGGDDDPAPSPPGPKETEAPVSPPTNAPFTLPPVDVTEIPTRSPAPTTPPTETQSSAPSSSSAPTQFIPEQIDLIATGDTYVTNGEGADENRGQLETLLVFKGLDEGAGVEEAFTLMEFNITEVPPQTNIFQRETSAMLKLTQIPGTVERDPVNMTVFRLMSTDASIEDFTNATFPPEDGIEGPTFEVAYDMASVTVDVSDLMFDLPPPSSTTRQSTPDTQFFIKIVATGAGSAEGNEFASRESDTPPELIVGLIKPTPSPTVSSQPTTSAQPTMVPTASPAPTMTPAPSMSIHPTLMPTNSTMNSTEMILCPVCEEGSSITIPDANVTLAAIGEPNVTATCAEVEMTYANEELVFAEECDALQEDLSSPCGCTMVNETAT